MVIPGAKDGLNVVSGFSKVIHITENDKVEYKDRIFSPGLLFVDDNGCLYHSNGIKPLSKLLESPILDTKIAILTAAERKMIADAENAGGLIITDSDNKIDDVHLHMVSDGRIDESYLSDYIEDGMVKLDALPSALRQHMKYVQTYDKLSEMTGEDTKGLVFVIDATGDVTVEKGWAIYQYREDEQKWEKIQEGSDIDYDYSSLVTHDTVEDTGAVMFDHGLHLSSVTLDMLGGLQPPTPATTVTSFVEGLTYNLACRDGVGHIAARLATENVIGEHSIVVTVSNCTVTGLGEEEITSVSKPIKGSVEKLNELLSRAEVHVDVGVVAELTVSADDGYDTHTYIPTYVSATDPVFTAQNNVVAFDDPSAWVTMKDFQLKAAAGSENTKVKILLKNHPCSSLRLVSTKRTKARTLSVSSTNDGILLEGTVSEINKKLAAGVSVSAGNSAVHEVLAVDKEPYRVIGTFEINYTGKIIYPLFETHKEYVELNVTDKASSLALVQQENVINNHDLFLTVTGDLTVTGFTSDTVDASSGKVKIQNTASELNNVLNTMQIGTGLKGGTVTLMINAHDTVVTTIEPINNVPTILAFDHNIPARHERATGRVILQTEKTRGEHYVKISVSGCTLSGVGEPDEPVGYPVILRGTMEELNEKLKQVVIHMSQPPVTGSTGIYTVELDSRVAESAFVNWIPEGYPAISIEPHNMFFDSEEAEYIHKGIKVDLTEVDPDETWYLVFARNTWVQCTLNDGKNTFPDVVFRTVKASEIKRQLETYGVKFHHVGAYSYQWIGCQKEREGSEHVFTNIASYHLSYTGATSRWPLYTWWTDSIQLAPKKSWSTKDIAIQATPNFTGEYTIFIIPQGDVKVIGMMPDGSEITNAASKSFTGTPEFINEQFDKGYIVQGESGAGGTVHIQIGNPNIYHGRAVQVLPK